MNTQRSGEDGLRSDAARNRVRIVETARELFRARGIDVPMSTIARHADVGVATLFRRFPTKEALVTEVFTEQIARCQALLDEAADDPDPWHGFCRLLEFTCAEQLKDRGFTEAFLALFADRVDYRKRRRDVETLFAKLVQRAQEAGRLRPDFAPGDLIMILLANGGLRDAPPEHAEDLSRRFVAYLLQTFSADGAAEREPLPPAGALGLHHAQRRGEDT
ncbi:TetR/AcrR family transcriptional regulator [Amycolatopsis jiangsuensis]|uniref:AcrR family transcriptional regulator n=1 Tax=Amycolatopsis jiangsuensis TaxID=1181879 RepID=A0A840ITU7_9PSEU|nr:helix-turn-helix domain-containing protein [Amycolatopsis jiangsuensis]MBB4684404.1 AcrR family transcriptional regulator [Amycolatopsis jiangsuensis]